MRSDPFPLMAVTLWLSATPAAALAVGAIGEVGATLQATVRPEDGAAARGPSSSLEARLEREAPAVPERGKAFACDATPIDPGGVEVELAYAPSWWAVAGDVDRGRGSAQPLVLAVGVGIARDLDARVAVGWSTLRDPSGDPGGPQRGSGLADSTLGARWRYLSLAEPAIDLAVTVGATLPTGTRTTARALGTSQGTWSLGGALVASADWERWTANAELGYTAPVRPREASDVGLLTANVALGRQVAPWLQPEVELNYQHELEAGPEPDERVLWASAGLVIPVAPARLVVGVRLPLWQSHAAAGPTVTAAVKLAF